MSDRDLRNSNFSVSHPIFVTLGFLKDAPVQGCNCGQANFSGSDLRGTSWGGADLWKAIHAIIVVWNDPHTVLTYAVLKANFSRCDMRNVSSLRATVFSSMCERCNNAQAPICCS